MLLVDTNSAVPKDQPKPQRLRMGKDKKEYVMIVQKMNCLAQVVDEARIAANNLEVLQVGCGVHLVTQPRAWWLSQTGLCT